MQSSKRRPYVKPTISKVSLVPDEAVLGGCKTFITGGGIGATGGSCSLAGCSFDSTS